ncbi:MAG: hypothetical protein HS130_07595 [Deltaproteobacteria bacterium]|nr:hypothetical protein [Deltaproteobacteria bacterium]MCL4873124.1 hypothetical protein [bacterium]
MANKVTIVIDANGKAYIDNMQKVEESNEKLETSTGRLTGKIKKHWLEASAAIYGAVKALQGAWNLAEQAAQYEQSRAAFRSMVEGMGHDAEQVFGRLRTLSAGMIDNKSLTEAANRAMSLQIPVEKLGDLMLVARAKARDMGISTTQAFNDLATGIGRGSPMIIDNLGLTLRLGEANEAMARSLGKSVEELSAKDQKLAILNSTLEAGREALSRHNLEVLTAKEKMEKLTATIGNLKLMVGAFIVKGGIALYGIFQGAAAAALFLAGGIFKMISALSKLSDWLGITSGATQRWEMDAEAAFAAADDLAKQSQENLKTLFESSETVMAAYAASQQQAKNESESTSKKIEELNKSLRSEIEKLSDEYNRLTMSASEYTEVQRKSLVAKGADIKLVNELTAAQQKLNQAKAAKEAEVTEARAEERIRSVVLATEKLNASKERQLELEGLELAGQGAATEQVERYIAARERQLEVERTIEEEKNKRQAEKDLVKLEQESPYEPTIENFEGDNEIVALQAKYQQKLGALHDYNAQVIQAMIDSGATQQQILDMYNHLEAETEKKKHELKLGYAADAAGAMSNILQNLYTATGSKNKAMFEAMKVFAIAETVISTYRGAQQAYTALAGIPIIGPALGVAAAAAAIAAGMARVQAIKSQQPGSTASISAGGSANPSYGGGSPNAYPVPQRLEPEKRPIAVQVHIYGNVLNNHDQLARDMIPSIQKALEDGVH